MIGWLVVGIAVCVGILIGLFIGIRLVLLDVEEIAVDWRLRAKAEPNNAYTLTACATELEYVGTQRAPRTVRTLR